MTEEVEPRVAPFYGHRFYKQRTTSSGSPSWNVTPEYASYLKTLPPSSYLLAVEQARDWIDRHRSRVAARRGYPITPTSFGDFERLYLRKSSSHYYNTHTHRPKYYY